MNYLLDYLDYNGNNRELAKHEGKEVQITGTVSFAGTIAVESIKDLA